MCCTHQQNVWWQARRLEKTDCKAIKSTVSYCGQKRSSVQSKPRCEIFLVNQMQGIHTISSLDRWMHLTSDTMTWSNMHNIRGKKKKKCWGHMHPTCTLQVNHWIPFSLSGVWQKPTSGDPTIKPVRLQVKEVKRERHVMTSTFPDWVAFQPSCHQLSALTHSPETPVNLLSEGEGPNNVSPSIVLVCGVIGVSKSWYKITNNLSVT